MNAVPGIGVVIASFTAGNYGTILNFARGGKVTVTGNLGNTSNGSVLLFVNGGTTATLRGVTAKSNTGDAYRYFVPNGTLVVDNSGALTNNTASPELLLAWAGGGELLALDANALARRILGRPITNTAMLGALVAVGGVVCLESAVRSIEEEMSPRLAGKNGKALRQAFSLAGGKA